MFNKLLLCLKAVYVVQAIVLVMIRLTYQIWHLPLVASYKVVYWNDILANVKPQALWQFNFQVNLFNYRILYVILQTKTIGHHV